MQTIVNILNSLVGFVIAVLLVIIAAAIVGYNAVRVQKDTATQFYEINITDLKKTDSKNREAFKPLESKPESTEQTPQDSKN